MWSSEIAPRLVAAEEPSRSSRRRASASGLGDHGVRAHWCCPSSTRAATLNAGQHCGARRAVDSAVEREPRPTGPLATGRRARGFAAEVQRLDVALCLQLVSGAEMLDASVLDDVAEVDVIE